MLVAIVGGGHMGKALARGLAGLAAVRVGARPAAQAGALARELGVEATDDLAACVRGADWVVAALRAGDFGALPPCPGRAALSVMGAVSAGRLARALGTDQVARAVPSLAVAARRGVTPWFAPPSLGEARRDELRGLWRALGGEVELGDERLLDLSASVGACAVAYYYLLTDALVADGVRLGCAPETSRRLVEGAFAGAAALLGGADVGAVAHPGGATERAVRALRAGGFEAAVSGAVDAAAARLVELSRQLGDSPFDGGG